MAYHYQCASCYCTLHLESAKEGEHVYSVVNGELCSSCQRHEDLKNDDDDD